jgi:hypothetical protein
MNNRSLAVAATVAIAFGVLLVAATCSKDAPQCTYCRCQCANSVHDHKSISGDCSPSICAPFTSFGRTYYSSACHTTSGVINGERITPDQFVSVTPFEDDCDK